jgi:hypothetical protein
MAPITDSMCLVGLEIHVPELVRGCRPVKVRDEGGRAFADCDRHYRRFRILGPEAGAYNRMARPEIVV